MGIGMIDRLPPPWVYYSITDSALLLRIKNFLIVELDSRETLLFRAMLSKCTAEEVAEVVNLDHRASFFNEWERVTPQEVLNLFERLRSQGLLREKGYSYDDDSAPHPYSDDAVSTDEAVSTSLPLPVTLKLRLKGAVSIIKVLTTLLKEDGLYKAHKYIASIKVTNTTMPFQVAMQVARREYWWIRLVTSLIEPLVGTLIQQRSGDECLTRALALSVYLRTLDIPAQVILGRRKYGTPLGGPKLHQWVALHSEPFEYNPNVAEGHEILYRYP